MTPINYFEFYGLPVKLGIDETLLKQKFFEISKKTHPDFSMNLSNAEQESALQLSTTNTLAYQKLKNSDSRISHVLEIYNIPEIELDAEFLSDMMDLNEEVMEAQMDTVLQSTVKEKIEGIFQSIQLEKEALVKRFDEEDQSEMNKVLLALKQLQLKNKYLLRLRESVNTFAGL